MRASVIRVAGQDGEGKAETIRPLSSPGLVPRGIYIPIIFGDDTRMRFLDLSDTISEVQK